MPTMPKIDSNTLSEAQETLLMPLWARARESKLPNPLIRDQQAEEMVAKLDFPFELFAQKSVPAVDYSLRASIFDQLIQEFLSNHPAATVVELGVGLDTRSDRIDNGKASWIGLDLPEVIEMRKTFLPETERKHMIAHSLLNPRWCEDVKQHCGETVIFTLEGVLYFFNESQVRELLSLMADHFPAASVIFDAQSPWFLKVSNARHPLQDSKLLFSLRNPASIETWDQRFQIKQYIGFGDSPYYDKGMKRLSHFRRWGRKLFPPSRHLFKIVHVNW